MHKLIYTNDRTVYIPFLFFNPSIRFRNSLIFLFVRLNCLHGIRLDNQIKGIERILQIEDLLGLPWFQKSKTDLIKILNESGYELGLSRKITKNAQHRSPNWRERSKCTRNPNSKVSVTRKNATCVKVYVNRKTSH